MRDYEDIFHPRSLKRIQTKIGFLPRWWIPILVEHLERFKEIDVERDFVIYEVFQADGCVQIKYMKRKLEVKTRSWLLKPFYFARNLYVKRKQMVRVLELEDDVKDIAKSLKHLTHETCEQCGKQPAGQHFLGLWIRTMCRDCADAEYERSYRN